MEKEGEAVKVKVRIQLNRENFPRFVKIAERMGVRRAGLLLYKQKSFLSAELVPNTKGLAKAFKKALEYYDSQAAERLAAEARLASEQAELTKRAREIEERRVALSGRPYLGQQ